VRRHFIGNLSRTQVRQVGAAFDTIRRRLAESASS
jgi:hypothetical protein